MVNDAGERHVVEVMTRTPEVTYGDHFYQRIRFCVTAHDAKSARIRVSFEITFVKSTMLKGTISKASLKGVTATYSKFAELLNGLGQ